MQGCAYISYPLVVAASGNHSLLDDVAPLVPWLISYCSQDLYLTPFLPHAAVDCILEHYRQNQDSNPALHDYLPCFLLGNYNIILMHKTPVFVRQQL